MVKKIFLGSLSGLLGGVAMVIAAVLLTRLLVQIIPNRSSGWEDLIYGVLAAILAYPLGAGLAAGLVLRRYSRAGMVWKAILTAYAVVILLMLIAEPFGLNVSSDFMFGAVVILPLIAIAAVFWLNRQREEASVGG